MWQWFKYYRIPVMLPSNMFDMVLQDIHSVASLYSCKCDINNIIHVMRFFFLICTFTFPILHFEKDFFVFV